MGSVLGMYEEVAGRQFDMGDEDTMRCLYDTAHDPVAGASVLYRDMSIFSKVQEAWSNQQDVLIPYGQDHAIIQENAVRSLAQTM
jgi:hypothetical protein